MSLEFEHCFGFRQGLNCITFYDENKIAFAAGKRCILQDLDEGHQRDFPLAEKQQISILKRDDNYIIAAIQDVLPSICVFQITSETKKIYRAPASMVDQEFTSISLSKSRQLVAAQGGTPSWLLVVWQCNTRDPLVTLTPVGGDPDSCWIHDISFSPCGSDELVVVGRGVFKLYEYQANAEQGSSPFVEHTFANYEGLSEYFCIAWPLNENLVVGSSNGQLLFFRGVDIIHEMMVFADLERLDALETIDQYRIESRRDVESVCVANEFLVCLLSGVAVLVYRGEEVTNYKLLKHVLVPYCSPTAIVQCRRDYLRSIVLSPEGTNIVATTCDGMWRNRTTSRAEEFSCLLEIQHNQPVIGVDTAVSKPLVASCSKHIIILWNYKSKQMEFRKTFDHQMTSIALHPSGLYLALSFRGFCSVFSILHNDLKEKQHINQTNSTVKFSSVGHLLAIAKESVISIYSFNSHECMYRFDGHAGTITSMAWKVSDSLLVSCDSRGVTCEWDVTTGKQNWEHTDFVSYASVTTDSSGDIVAIGLNKTVSCLRNGSFSWKIETKKQLTTVIYHPKSSLFYAGTVDGCVVCFSFPSPEERVVAYVHSGKVTGICLNHSQDMLVSVSDDGFVFLTRLTGENNECPHYIYANLSLVNCPQLQRQQDKADQIKLSLEYADNVDACENEVDYVNHERYIRELTLHHEKRIKLLNDNIFSIREEMQQRLLDRDPLTEETQIDQRLQRDVMDLTAKLGEVYRRSDSYEKENRDLVESYTATIETLSNNHAKFASDEQTNREKMAKEIKELENELLLKEQEVIIKRKEFSDKTNRNSQEETAENIDVLTLRELLEAEKERSMDLIAEMKKLKYMIAFRTEDTRTRRNIAAGEINYDIKEKIDAITFLKESFHKLESSLKAKQKLMQTQEQKFCSMRTLVSSLRKKFGVSKTALEELTQNIRSKDLQIESCQEQLKLSFPNLDNLEKESEIVQGLCETLIEKVGETYEGLQNKQKQLRETQEVLSRYTTMLHRCLSREYDLNKLVTEITKLFEDSCLDFTDDSDDPRVIKEYDYQIQRLKQAYDLIKGEPAKCARDKSMAEFRLSQANCKILQEVHEIQKEDARLRSTLNAMEGALLLQTTPRKKEGKSTEEDMRCKIEFVTHFEKKRRFCSIDSLDKFIEEQQKEVARFKTMLSDKESEK